MSALTKVLRSADRRNFNRVLFSLRDLHTEEKNVVKCNYPEIKIPKEPLWHFVFEWAYKWPHRTAVECGISGRKFTYDQLRRNIAHFNRFLRKRLKLKAGDVVAIMLPNVPEYPIALLGTIQAGLIPTTVNPIYTKDEVFRQLKQTSVSVVVTLDSYTPLVKKACQDIYRDITIIAVTTQPNSSLEKGVLSFKQVIDSRSDIEDAPFRDFKDAACLLYSSGTTGLPKPLELTMENLVSNGIQVTSPNFVFLEETTPAHQDVVPAILPFYHVYGIVTLIWMLHQGCKIVTLPKFQPEIFTETLKNYKPHVLLVVPPIVLFLTTNPMVKREYLETIRILVSGAAPLGALDEAKLLEKAKPNVPKFIQGYGLSECGVITISSNGKPKEPGSAGELLPNSSAKIVPIGSDTTEGLPPNAIGELYVKGPQVFKGYFNNNEANENAFSDGWFKTGDVAYYDENGSFFIADRIKDFIKVNAFPVAPAELEEVIRNYNGVADAAVIGIPDKKYGEVPRAFVVAKEGCEINPDKLIKYVKGVVAPYKQLKGGVLMVDSIPKNPSGKILKRQLKEDYKINSN